VPCSPSRPAKGILAHREPDGVLHAYVALSKPQEWIAGLDFRRPRHGDSQGRGGVHRVGS
jgi:hypothetical protein